jgi:hypothetical protein
MARKKRNSTAFEKVVLRLSGMKSIDPNLDLGNGLSVSAVETRKLELEGKLAAYNEHLSNLDADLNDVKSLEKDINQLNRRILQAVGSAYGYDSNAYEMIGGVRNSDRKKPTRKTNEPESTQ